MMMTTVAHTLTRPQAEIQFQEMLDRIDVRIGGNRPWDLQVHNARFYTESLPYGTKGVLDAYVDGWWDCDQLDVLADRVLSNNLKPRGKSLYTLVFQNLASRLTNRQTKRGSLAVRRHYDIGNDLYSAMLDSRMNYSCGYWREAATLDQAQEAKLDLICRKIDLQPGQRVLDIGCGWGGFAGFAAERYGASVVGVTLSEPQAALGGELSAGLPVTLRVQDYRDVSDGPYDAIVSIGMFEHVGYRNYRTFFEVCRRLLKPQGTLLLHTIGGLRSHYTTDPWFDANIFPHSMLPSAKQIAEATEGLFVMEDWHSFGHDYDPTLMAWNANFEASWPALRAKYGERFRRMWRAYLLTSAAAFRARRNQLWQIVYSPRGIRGGYRSVR